MLNDSVNFGRYPGKYYTLKEAKELVAFCKAHRVMLIPEVDMPGHSAAFRKTFRHDMQSKEGMAILKLLMALLHTADRALKQPHQIGKCIKMIQIMQPAINHRYSFMITDAFPNEGDLKRVFPPEQKMDTVYEYEGKRYGLFHPFFNTTSTGGRVSKFSFPNIVSLSFTRCEAVQ